MYEGNVMIVDDFLSFDPNFTLSFLYPSVTLLQVPVEVFAQYCHKKVEKMAQSGAKKGLKKPTLEEVVHAKVGWGGP